MNWKIELSPKAHKQYLAFDGSIKKQIRAKLAELEAQENPLTLNNTKPLTHTLKGFYRIRSGDYRIIFFLLHQKKIITVVNMGIRSKVYE